jgi:hypothetical protein
MDEDTADLETVPRPMTLHQIFDSADDDIGAQAPAVEPHVAYRPVGGYEER